ncbi:MAG: hybrid sensor histidine kinase/response regulator [Desulfobacteraceae bacterium]|nr:MAG: hybrid sensor histidine kinase/response regulator [Desulfobacteraceae bacterium]
MADNQIVKTEFVYKILVIDDEKRIRDVTSRLLTQEGFEVAVAETGDMGMKMIEKTNYDIILLDLMMPGISGLEVLPYLKANHPYSVVIVITGYATLEHSIEAMKKGAFDFIPKPFEPKDLRIVITKAVEFLSTLQDIANEKSRMGVLVNQLSGGVMATDTRKRIALANPAFLKMIDYFGQDVIGRQVSEVFQNESIERMIDQALAMSTETISDFTKELDFGKNILSVRCIPFRDRLNRNLGTITVMYDITALKKIDQLKTDFVNMVAHEIRSPLNSIAMQLKVILDGLAGAVTEKQKEILDRASKKINALSNLSTELLDLAKIESGLITQEKEEFQIGSLLEDQVAFFQQAAVAKGISLELDAVPGLPPVLANKRNMEEVFSNLITNAIHYTPENGKISILAVAVKKHLCVSITDTGFGIPSEDLPKIFDRFYRVKNEKTRYITGTGLGLPIVKSILDAHNGKIRVESEPDKGSTFYVYLPI